MGVAKVTLNGTTLIDTTGKTVTSSSMLSGITALDKKGDNVTGNISSKSSTDLTVSGATVTAPAGYYANAASKAVATTTHPNPTASITSSTGVVTASHTQTTGYVTSGTTTGTLSLTTQAGKTVTPTESAQTAVASYRWTTGTVSVAAISSTYVGSGIPTRSAADMTVAAQSVTAPAGYYSQAFTKAVTVTTHPNPTAAIVSSTGVVTATHTQTAGYVAAGTTTGTLNLTTQAAATYNTSTADQTIASYRWLTGTQTIKSVTTSNLTAANIKSGVTVKVGDANNASRITQVTGTLKEGKAYTATIGSDGGDSSRCYVQYNGTKYYTVGQTFTFYAGDTLIFYLNSDTNEFVFGMGAYYIGSGPYSYSYTAIGCNIGIWMTSSENYSNIAISFGNENSDDEHPNLRLDYSYNTENRITPTKAPQYITPHSSYYGLGYVNIQGDSNLIAGNIKSGVSIFGVSGTYYPVPSHVATVVSQGIKDDITPMYNYVTYSNTDYYTVNNTFTFYAGDSLECVIQAYNTTAAVSIYTNGQLISTSTAWTRYSYTLPDYDINIQLQSNLWTMSLNSTGYYPDGNTRYY